MKYFAFFCLLGIFVSSHSQNNPDTISYKEIFNGYQFYYLNQPLKTGEVSALLEEKNEWAFDEFESAREARFFGYIFASLGTALIIYPFATAVIEHESNWALTYAGVGFVGLSIPIFNSYHQKTEEAIKMFNHPPSTGETLKSKTAYELGISGNGLALRCRF